MLNFIRTTVVFVVLLTSFVVAKASERNDLAPHLSGTWEMLHANGVVERLTMTRAAGRTQGRFTNVKIFRGRQLERFSGRWHIRSNSLLRPESQTQLQLVWVDRRWGRRVRNLAIRRITTQQLKFGNVLNTAQIITFQRISR